MLFLQSHPHMYFTITPLPEGQYARGQGFLLFLSCTQYPQANPSYPSNPW